MQGDNNMKSLQEQLDDYTETYDNIGKYLETETNATKRRMAEKQRSHTLCMMLSLRMQVAKTVTNTGNRIA